MSDKQLLLTRTQLLHWFLVLPTICCPLLHPHCIDVIVQDEHKVSDATGRKQPRHIHDKFKGLFVLDCIERIKTCRGQDSNPHKQCKKETFETVYYQYFVHFTLLQFTLCVMCSIKSK